MDKKNYAVVESKTSKLQKMINREKMNSGLPPKSEKSAIPRKNFVPDFGDDKETKENKNTTNRQNKGISKSKS